MKKIEIPAEQTIVASDDTISIAINYYTGKLRQLEYVVNQYNFLDHAIQIAQIARDIGDVKKKLKELEVKKKALFTPRNAN